MTTKTGKKVEKFDKFSDRLQGLVSLSDGGTAATFNDFTLGGINDLDGLVITDQPISAGSSFDVVVTEMRVFGNPLVSPEYNRLPFLLWICRYIRLATLKASCIDSYMLAIKYYSSYMLGFWQVI